MAPQKVQINSQNGCTISKKSSCRMSITLPLGLPALVDESVPPPPYYPPNDLFALRPYTVPAWTRIITGLLAELFGADAKIVREFKDGEADGYFTESFHGKWVPKGSYDQSTGSYIDQHGESGCGVYAYMWFPNKPDAMFIIQGFHFIVDYRVAEGDEKPDVVEFVASEKLHKGKVVFTAKKLEGSEKARINGEIAKAGRARSNGQAGATTSPSD